MAPRSVFWLFPALLLLVCRVSLGQTLVKSNDDTVKPRVVEMNIDPMASSKPILEHRLYPSRSSMQKGDAATLYHRAMMFLRNQRLNKDFRKNKLRLDRGEKVPFNEMSFDEISDRLPDRLSETELRELEKVITEDGGSIFKELKFATFLQDCDWGFDVNNGRSLSEYISFLLPEMQELRSVARYLIVRARVQIGLRDFEGAVETMRVGFRMAKTTEETRFIICSLIGIACSSLMLDQVEGFIGTKGAPNLYWSLEVLPQPPVSIRPAFVHEVEFLRNGAGIEILRKPEAIQLSPEQWSLKFNRGIRELFQVSGGVGMSRGANEDLAQLGSLVFAMRGYPIAKQKLMEWGFEKNEIQNMPTAQVIAIHESRMLKIIADEILKCENMPLPEASRQIEAIIRKVERTGDAASSTEFQELMPVASALLPSITQALRAENRVVRRLRVLQTIEAIRLHLAKNGSFPESLADIKIVPIPNSPDTGKPYVYQRTSDGCRLWEMDPDTLSNRSAFTSSREYRLKTRSK